MGSEENYQRDVPFGDSRVFSNPQYILLRPPLNIEGEYSVILAGYEQEYFSIDLLANDEFEAVTLAIQETGWNYRGLITVDTWKTISDDLEPLLAFEYEVL